MALHDQNYMLLKSRKVKSPLFSSKAAVLQSQSAWLTSVIECAADTYPALLMTSNSYDLIFSLVLKHDHFPPDFNLTASVYCI